MSDNELLNDWMPEQPVCYYPRDEVSIETMDDIKVKLLLIAGRTKRFHNYDAEQKKTYEEAFQSMRAKYLLLDGNEDLLYQAIKKIHGQNVLEEIFKWLPKEISVNFKEMHDE